MKVKQRMLLKSFQFLTSRLTMAQLSILTVNFWLEDQKTDLKKPLRGYGNVNDF